jgi:hypothetical protein
MAIIGFNTALAVDTSTVPPAAAGTYTTLNEVVTVSIPTGDVTVVDATHIAVTNGWKVFLPGLKDGGVMSFESNFTKADFTTLNTQRGVNRHWRITAPDEDPGAPTVQAVFTFQGFITKLEASFEAEAVVKIKGELKVTGAIGVA